MLYLVDFCQSGKQLILIMMNNFWVFNLDFIGHFRDLNWRHLSIYKANLKAM